MKKLLTRRDREKISRRNQLILGGILILLMLLSTAGYALIGRTDDSNSVGRIEHNGIIFYDQNGYWTFNLNNNDFVFHYNPEEVSDIRVGSYQVLGNYQNKPLYIVTNNREAYIEIGGNLNNYVLRINEACLEGQNCTGNFPIKECSNNNDNIVIIQDTEDNNEERIYQEENCVFITAKYENQTRFSDAFLYKVLGIN